MKNHCCYVVMLLVAPTVAVFGADAVNLKFTDAPLAIHFSPQLSEGFLQYKIGDDLGVGAPMPSAAVMDLPMQTAYASAAESLAPSGGIVSIAHANNPTVFLTGATHIPEVTNVIAIQNNGSPVEFKMTQRQALSLEDYLQKGHFDDAHAMLTSLMDGEKIRNPGVRSLRLWADSPRLMQTFHHRQDLHLNPVTLPRPKR